MNQSLLFMICLFPLVGVVYGQNNYVSFQNSASTFINRTYKDERSISSQENVDATMSSSNNYVGTLKKAIDAFKQGKTPTVKNALRCIPQNADQYKVYYSYTDPDSMTITEIDLPFICSLAKQMDKQNAAYIQRNSNKIISSIGTDPQNEACIFSLVDSLSNAAIKNPDSIYLGALDVLGKESDGFLSEYMSEIGKRLFYQDFTDIVRYLSQNPGSSLRQIVLNGLNTAFINIDKEQREEALSKLKSEFDEKVREAGLNAEEAAVVTGILNEINPGAFD